MWFKKLLCKRNYCNHCWTISEISNVLQLDDMGYPLRLVIYKCSNCGKSEQQWVDVGTKELKELETGESVLLKWKGIER